MKAKPNRRWFRFSLRTLLVFVTIACAGFGWLGMKVRQARRQKDAVVAIRELRGMVTYDYEEGSHQRIPPQSARLWKWMGVDFFQNVSEVSFWNFFLMMGPWSQILYLRTFKP
jgi:hypothetical protein